MFACCRQDSFNYIPIWTQWHYLLNRFISISSSLRRCRGSTLASRFRATGGFRVVPRVLVDNSWGQGETTHLSQSKIIQIVISFIRPLSGNVDNLLGIRVMGRAFQSFSLEFPWGEGAEALFVVRCKITRIFISWHQCLYAILWSAMGDSLETSTCKDIHFHGRK